MTRRPRPTKRVLHQGGTWYPRGARPKCCLHYGGVFIDKNEIPEFACPRCKRRVGWCMGAADDMPDICDLCWNEIEALPVTQRDAQRVRWRRSLSRKKTATRHPVERRAATRSPKQAGGVKRNVARNHARAIR